MSSKLGIVVATHPEDNSVDLVMTDGARLVGVQVQTPSGSARSGTVDLPEVPETANKWDITKENGQDMKAVVTFFDGLPIVTGFLYPQVSQMTFKDPKLKLTRHQSDVYSFIDGDGNAELVHPSGAYVRMGETPDHVDQTGKNEDKSMAIDRNTGRKPHIRVVVPGAFDLKMTPDGQLTLTLAKGATIKAPDGITLDTPMVTVPNGDVVASGISLVNHLHTGVVPGGALTGQPT